jgi:hypothetical protein
MPTSGHGTAKPIPPQIGIGMSIWPLSNRSRGKRPQELRGGRGRWVSKHGCERESKLDCAYLSGLAKTTWPMSDAWDQIDPRCVVLSAHLRRDAGANDRPDQRHEARRPQACLASILARASLDGAYALLSGVRISWGSVAFSIGSMLLCGLILQVGSAAGFAMVFALAVAATVWNLGGARLGVTSAMVGDKAAALEVIAVGRFREQIESGRVAYGRRNGRGTA